MKKIALLLLIFVNSLIYAAPIDRNAAEQKAHKFFAGKAGARKQIKCIPSGIKRAASSMQEPFYVFQIDGGGFVLVSGDDRTEDILGYSMGDTYDLENMPCNMKALLQEYANVIELLASQDTETAPTDNDTNRDADKEPIAPLLQTHWNQSAPYNHYCPVVSNKQTPTGCVATAMAQIMGYYRWPAANTAEIPGYTSSTHKIGFEAIPAGTPINWNLIADSYERAYHATESENAVAHLMQYCGQAVSMNYKPGGSSASTQNAITALVNYFDYDATTARYVKRVNYNYSEWRDIIYHELKEQRPVIYSGKSAGGSHAFVCDGYDSNEDMFHINWGWGGNSDGYFRLNLLNPKEQGEGGSTTDDGYNIGQGCGIGLQKNPGTYDNTVTLYARDFTFDTKEFKLDSSKDAFVISGLKCVVANRSGGDGVFDLGVRVTSMNGQDMEDITCLSGFSLSNGYKSTKKLGNITVGASLYADGDYQMFLTSRKSGTSTWCLCHDSDVFRILFSINGNLLTITNVEPVKNLEVTQVAVEGNHLTNSPQTVTMTIKNNGTDYRSDIYYMVNPIYNSEKNNYDYESDNAAAFLEVAAGESVQIQFKFTPTTSGVNELLVYTANDNEPLGEMIQMTVTGNYELDVTDINIDKSDSEKKTIAGETFHLSLKIINTGESAFEGSMTVEVIGHNTVDNKNYIISALRDIINNIVINPGDSYQIDKTFNKRKDSEKYKYDTYYVRIKKNDETQPFFQTDVYTFVEESSGIDELYVSPQRRQLRVYTLQGQRIEQPTKHGVYIVNSRKIVK